MAIAYTNLPKPAWDERRISHDFTDDLATGDTIASIVSISVTDKDTGESVAGAVVDGSSQIDSGDKSVSAIYAGGIAGQRFVMTARVVTSNGEKLSGIIEMEISA